MGQTIIDEKGANMNYEVVVNDKGYKQVRFPDGSTSAISMSDEGKEYFSISNPYSNDNFGLFIDKIKDAIQAIRDGYGDVLVVRHLFGKSESVQRFIDREYGEKLRKKTIEGFKDAEFGYSLKFGYLGSMSGNSYVSKDEDIIGLFDNQSDIIYFENEKDANTLRLKLIADAEKVLKEFKEIKSTKDDKAYNDFLKKNMDGSVVSKMWTALAEPSDTNEFKFVVVQVMKPLE